MMVMLSSLLATFPAVFWLKQLFSGKSDLGTGKSPTEPPGADQVDDKRIRPNLGAAPCSLSHHGRHYKACSCKLMVYRRQMKSSPSCPRRQNVNGKTADDTVKGGKKESQATPRSFSRPPPQPQQPQKKLQQQQQQQQQRQGDPILPPHHSLLQHAAVTERKIGNSSIESSGAAPQPRNGYGSAKGSRAKLPTLRESPNTASLSEHCTYNNAARMASNVSPCTGESHNLTGNLRNTFDFEHGSPGGPSRESGEEERTALRGNGAIFEDGLVLEEIPTTSSHVRSDIWNGQSIRSCTLHECMQSKQTLYREGNQLPPELAYLQIPAEEYACAVDHIQGCSKVKHYSLCYNKWLHSCAFSFLFLAVWTLGFILWIFDLVSVKMGTGVFFLVGVASVLLCVFFCHCIQSKFDGRARKMIAKANEIFTKYHVMIGLLEEGMLTCYRLSIHFIYFDLAPCLETLAEELGKHMKRKVHKKQKHLTLERLPSVSDTDLIIPSMDITDSQRHELAQDLLLLYCDKYVDHLVTGRLRMPKVSRHAQEVPCVCQFIQSQFFYRSESTLGASENIT